MLDYERDDLTQGLGVAKAIAALLLYSLIASVALLVAAVAMFGAAP